MDIRGRCDYILNKKDFKKCPARIDTAIFMFDNDYSFYTMMENAKNMRSKNAIIRKYLLKTMKLTRPDANKAIELYWNQKNQEQEEEEEHPSKKFFENHDCKYCPIYFNEGKDFCKSCGFDLNIWNKSDEEE